MSNGDTQKMYTWQWPADRIPDIRLLAKVSKFEKQKEGLLGTNKSPSIAGNLPDAHVLTGTIVEGSNLSSNQVFTLTLPRIEAVDIAVNDYVALGIIDKDICICIAKVPSSESRAKMVEWLANWKCSKK
ncbi:MAG: hypothetical protein ACKVQK_18950 [Burkholderiales bacterium]